MPGKRPTSPSLEASESELVRLGVLRVAERATVIEQQRQRVQEPEAHLAKDLHNARKPA